MQSSSTAPLNAHSRNASYGNYLTNGGIRVQRHIAPVCYATSIDQLRDRLDEERGVLLSSSYEFPGRYIAAKSS